MPYAEDVLFLTRYLHATNAEQFPDRYAALRHALFLTNRLLEDEPLPAHAVMEEISAPVSDDLRRVTIQEYGWATALMRGAEITPTLIEGLPHKQRAALLRAVVRAGAHVPTRLLLDQIGISNTLDSLVRDALALLEVPPPNFGDDLREIFDGYLTPRRMRPLTTLLDVAANHRSLMLDTVAVSDLLPQWDDHERLSIALVRYGAALGLTGIVPLLEEMLVTCGDYTFAQRFAVVDALVRLAGRGSLPTLEAASSDLARGLDGQICTLFQERLTATMAAVEAQPALSDREGLVVAQFMLQGTIGQAGEGNSGGLGVFLASLGDALGELPEIAQVVTLVLLTPSQAATNPPLAIRRTPGHTVLHAPICCRDALTQYQLMVQEEEIRRALIRVLEIHGVRPDVVHLRYADHGTRAAARVARELGSRIVFTLTSDPHRRLTEAFTERRAEGLQAKALTFDLHKVFIADQLLKMADILVAMPTGHGVAPLKAYFPQLVIAQQGRQPKPLHAIAEGIQLLRDVSPEPDPTEMRDLLTAADLAPDAIPARPIVLSVGRLNPVKQQDLLVEAWAASGLYETHELVLIGGSVDRPTRVERQMLAQIEAALQTYPDARDHYRLLPAMPNTKVRRLEQAIICARPARSPHIYACPSVKEEFGIAVLEAMDAGFLVIGPVVGGLSSYIVHGENGFLMDTASSEAIAKALQELTSTDTRHLSSIAQAGTLSVQAQFDIRTTAMKFAQVYRLGAANVRSDT